MNSSVTSATDTHSAATGSPFKGVWIPLVTPFKGAQIDEDALAALVKCYAAAGVHGFVACGSTGEAAALTKEERLAVLDITLAASGGVPVVMGLSGNNMEELLAQVESVNQRAVAGLLVPAPYYIRPSQQGIEYFYRTLAGASRAPLVLYDIPYRTGVTVETTTTLALLREGTIVAMKDCGAGSAHTMRLLGGGMRHLMAGEDASILSTLALGGTGFIAASAHLRPDLFVELFDSMQSGRVARARAVFYHLLPLIEALFREPNPAPLKAVLSMDGLIRNELRRPMMPCSDGLQDELAKRLEALNAIEIRRL